MRASGFEPVSLQPGDEVLGWRIHHLWRKDTFSVTYVVERNGERRLLRLALRGPDSPEGRHLERFLEREAGALRRVQHPSILRLHEEGRWPAPLHGFRYLLMDPVEGPTLLDWRRRGDVTLARFAQVSMQLAQALVAMRHEGLNHGSIRPENILIRESDERPFLVDFSLAMWPGNPFPPDHLPTAEAGGPEGLEFLLGWADEGPRGAADFQVPVISSKRFTH
jgi:eukaryotic-like serine/threonine-protein kinase